MIAEAWDIGTYQVGWFPNGWGDWNGRFRDATRGYMQTGFGVHDGLSYTDGFHGTYDRYYRDGVGGPHYSINFIVAHDGLTLADLVSYPGTGNARNGTLGWPFGPSDGGNGDDNVISFDGYDNKHLRRQTIRNYFTWLMFARGVPMIVYGDEFGRTQNGNNNPYNIDSVATWNNYNMINTDSPQAVATGDGGAYDNNLGTDDSADNINDLFVFASKVMNLRQNSKALRQNNYNMTIDYAKEDGSGDFNSNSDRCVRIHIKGSEVGDVDYLIMSNMWEEMIQFNIPAAANGKQWVRIIDTAAWAEGEDYKNFWDDADADGIENSYGVNPWSMVVLKLLDGSGGGTPDPTDLDPDPSKVTLRMTKDVGPGNAIYFTGSFVEGEGWSKAIQGDYDSANGSWFLEVTPPSGGEFIWKTLKGSWVAPGESITKAEDNFPGLTWEGGGDHDQTNLHPPFNGGF
jgi:glycogen operon protein